MDQDEPPPRRRSHPRVIPPGALDVEPVKLLAPVDAKPLRVRVSVGVGPLRGAGIGKRGARRGEGEELVKQLLAEEGAAAVRAAAAHACPIRSSIGISWICGGWRWSQRIPRGRSAARSTSITARGVATRSTGR